MISNPDAVDSGNTKDWFNQFYKLGRSLDRILTATLTQQGYARCILVIHLSLLATSAERSRFHFRTRHNLRQIGPDLFHFFQASSIRGVSSAGQILVVL